MYNRYFHRAFASSITSLHHRGGGDSAGTVGTDDVTPSGRLLSAITLPLHSTRGATPAGMPTSQEAFTRGGGFDGGFVHSEKTTFVAQISYTCTNKAMSVKCRGATRGRVTTANFF